MATEKKGRHRCFRHSRAANSIVSGLIWPKFKLMKAYMHVQATFNFLTDRINSNRNQRTNAPVNVHLKYGTGISTISKFELFCPCRKIGHGRRQIIIYKNFVDADSPMVHVKFQDRQTSGSEEVFKGFTIYQ